MNNELDYKLGVIWQDIQHRRIVKIAKELSSSSQIDYNSILAQLRYYIEEHFEIEEQYMRKYCYEKIDLHIEEHNSFIYKLDEITKTNFTGDTLNANLSSFLNKWFLNHILKVDNELAVFLLKRENNNAGQVNRVTE